MMTNRVGEYYNRTRVLHHLDRRIILSMGLIHLRTSVLSILLMERHISSSSARELLRRDGEWGGGKRSACPACPAKGWSEES